MSARHSSPLAGRTVRTVRFLSLAELAREAWGQVQPVVALEFTDGALIYAACDPEGNGPGALFGVTPVGQTHWVLPANHDDHPVAQDR